MNTEMELRTQHPLQFSLRLLMAIVFGLAVAFGIGRWSPAIGGATGCLTIALAIIAAGCVNREHFRRVAIFAMLLLTISLGAYSRKGGATRLGFPLQWLECEELVGSTALEWRVKWPESLLAATAVFLGATVFSVLADFVRSRSRCHLTLNDSIGLAAIAITAFAVGCLPLVHNSDPYGGWKVFGCLALVDFVVLVGTWRAVSFANVFIGSVAAIVALWWGAQMIDHWRDPHIVHDVELVNDLIAPFVFLLVFMVPPMLITAVRRFLRRSKGATPHTP
ncbi:MAG TPA: hypothetical protein VGN42_14900 [Pirellulales bacterium]|jgi:hypothetical protein|nr:hypothetical protein [Pirellulales bacterium]